MTCPIDGRPLLPNAVICAVCEGVLERALGDVDALLDDLDVTLTRQARKRPSRGNQASDGPPLMFDARASEAGRDLNYLLGSWVGDVAVHISREGRFVQMPADKTSQALSAWMMHHIHWIATRFSEAADLYSEIVGAVNNIRRTIDRAPDARFLGPCGTVFEGVECTETVYAIDGNPTARCRTCGTSTEVADRTTTAATQATNTAVTSLTLTRTLALGGIPLKTDRIRTWAHRGLLTRAGIGARGHPTYIIAHVARLIHLHETGQKLTPWNQEQDTA